MGFFSSVGKALVSPITSVTSGLLGGFSTGSSSATRSASNANTSIANQAQELVELLKPSIETGTEYLGSLGNYTNAPGLDELYREVSGGDLANSMIADRTRSAENALASAGLRRSGTRVKSAADIETGVITELMNQIIGNTQNVAQIGLGQGGSALGGLNVAGNAYNNRYAAEMNQANRNTDILGGLFNGVGSIFGGLLSDPRLKTNVQKVGEYGPLDICRWDWVDGFDPGEYSLNQGFMADQVAAHCPQHVKFFDFEGRTFLALDYDGILKEYENV